MDDIRSETHLQKALSNSYRTGMLTKKIYYEPRMRRITLISWE